MPHTYPVDALDENVGREPADGAQHHEDHVATHQHIAKEERSLQRSSHLRAVLRK